MSNEELASIIDEIAKTHHVILGVNDPLMIAFTMCQRIVIEVAQKMDEAYANHLGELEVLAQRTSEEHRKEAGDILTEVINAHKTALDKSMKDHAEYAKTISADITKEMQPIIQAWINSLNNTKRIGTLNIVASALVFLCACVLAIVVFFK